MSLPRLFDAHNHLHDARLDPHRGSIDATLESIGLAGAVVNGTREEDWAAVIRITAARPGLLASFGLHPWYVPSRSPEWLEKLVTLLNTSGPRVGVGEIGLDAWIPEHDLDDQRKVMLAQLQLAADRNLPATIHCIQAWGPLLDTLRAAPRLPERGFLIHAYGGPAEMVVPFAKLGAYFSFNPAHLAEKKHARREVFRHIPAERLLVETDAPDMAPPVEYNRHPLPPGPDGRIPNHPANLAVTYEELARLRSLPLPSLASLVEENFRRLFG
jgi:TatD DNase family protein